MNKKDEARKKGVRAAFIEQMKKATKKKAAEYDDADQEDEEEDCE
jgi:hypothetical protein